LKNRCFELDFLSRAIKTKERRTEFPHHKLLVIKTQPDIRKGRKTLYHAVRWAWRIDPARARKAEYILGCVKDECHGVFIADEWK
jgi:hypothetical protein